MVAIKAFRGAESLRGMPLFLDYHTYQKEAREKGGEDVALYQKIAYYREKAGMSQRELADRAGLSPGAIGQYETNRKTPRLETLRRLADALGVSVAELLSA